jgi:hypothetical protein
MGSSSEGRLQPTRGLRLRRRAFFCLMGGFLVLPIIPVEFTSIITAVVWSVSGGLPAVVFLIAGTFFRLDSPTIFSGIAGVAGHLFPGYSTALDEAIAIAVMLAGNLATAYLFKRIVRTRLLNRIPNSSLLSRIDSL